MRPLALGLAVTALIASGCGAGEIDDAGGTGGGGGGGGGSNDAAPPISIDGEPEELAGITAAHNAVRGAHGVGDITWDDDLAAVAQAWADGCQWGHNDGRSDNYPGYVGENIYGSSGVPTGQAVVSAWASEEADYDYESNSCSDVCGHYTQIVWADSTKLGCAIASCPGGQVANFVVCNYAPGGNYQGQRPY